PVLRRRGRHRPAVAITAVAGGGPDRRGRPPTRVDRRGAHHAGASVSRGDAGPDIRGSAAGPAYHRRTARGRPAGASGATVHERPARRHREGISGPPGRPRTASRCVPAGAERAVRRVRTVRRAGPRRHRPGTRPPPPDPGPGWTAWRVWTGPPARRSAAMSAGPRRPA